MSGPHGNDGQPQPAARWASERPSGQFGGAARPGAGQQPGGAPYPGAPYPGAPYPGAPYPGAAGEQAGPSGYPIGAGYATSGYPGPYAAGQAPYSAGPAAAGSGQSPYGWPSTGWDQDNARRDTGPTILTTGPGAPGSPRPNGLAGPPRTLGAARLLGLAVALLGAVNFVLGFLPEVSARAAGLSSASLSVFAVGPAYVPILLLIAGLLALAAFLPGGEVSRLAVAAVSVGGAVGAIVSLGVPGSFELFANPNQVTRGLGAILLVVFGIVQAVVAIGAYVVGAGRTAVPTVAGQPASPVASPTSSMAQPASPMAQPASPVAQPAPAAWSVGGPPWSSPVGAAATAAEYPAADRYANPAAYSGPPAPLPYRDEPATGPQVVVGTETNSTETNSTETSGTATSGTATNGPGDGTPVGVDEPSAPDETADS